MLVAITSASCERCGLVYIGLMGLEGNITVDREGMSSAVASVSKIEGSISAMLIMYGVKEQYGTFVGDNAVFNCSVIL
jgi:hypothetical protein